MEKESKPLFAVGDATVTQTSSGTYVLNHGKENRIAQDLQGLRGLLEEDDLLSGEKECQTSSWTMPQLLDFWSTTVPGWGGIEARVDDIVIVGTACGPLPELYAFADYDAPIKSTQWDLGGVDYGSYSLYSFGARYLVVLWNGGEYSVEELAAADDQDAIVRFEEMYPDEQLDSDDDGASDPPDQ